MRANRVSWASGGSAAVLLAACAPIGGAGESAATDTTATSITVSTPAMNYGAAVFDTNSIRSDQPDTAGPVGACGSLISGWAYGKPADVRSVWELVLDDRWHGLSAVISAHADDVCPNRPDSWRSEGDCPTADGWTFAGAHDWRASSGGGAYQEFTDWGLTHHDAGGRYESFADGRITTYVDRHDGDGAVEFGLVFENFHHRIAHSGAYDAGGNRTWSRDGALTTSAMGWPVSGQAYVQIFEFTAVPLGDLCVTYDLAEVPDCTLEPAGTFTLVGTNRVVVTFDGDVACDGCGALTADGVGAGTLCLGT